MVDLKAKPFYLNDEQIEWVEETINNMTLDEKIGQLMVTLQRNAGYDEEEIKTRLDNFHQGSLRWAGGDKEAVYKHNIAHQKFSKTPILVACNCDDGGIGCLPKEGTFVSTAVQACAGGDTDTAYNMGYVAARESRTIGCNWMFNPCVDIYMNWRNTIVNTRSFGDNADDVIKHARSFINGVHEGHPNMACCAKHFPGDGIEELDQHLVLGLNDLSVDNWKASYGKVYDTLIDDGIESIMVGHIAFPEMSRKMIPGIEDKDIMPATLAPELLNGLLREEMGFNGVIVTDATHMIGFSAMMQRKDALPQAVASGCDVILFAADLAEDIGYLKDGLKNGIFTEERLHDALSRILGLKAKLNLTNENIRIPSPALKDEFVGCKEHTDTTAIAADKCITLVKDTKNYIPALPENNKKVLLVYIQSTPISKGYSGDPVKQLIVDELINAGYDVEVAPNFHDLEVEYGVNPNNTPLMMHKESREGFKAKYSHVFLFLNIKGYAQENNVRVRFSCAHSNELPWYASEVPTIGVSLNYTNHLIDIPQVHTFINAYAPHHENIKSVIAKIKGESKFKGTASETVFCGRWDTRL